MIPDDVEIDLPGTLMLRGSVVKIGDGFCDAAMVVVDVPGICPKSAANLGDDCDDNSDGAAEVHPGANEIVDNGRDDDCDGQIPADELDAMVDRAQGNPLFLIELVQARMESGGGTELPTTLEGIIAARIDRLAADDRRMLRHVAVLGDRITVKIMRQFDADAKNVRLEGNRLRDFFICIIMILIKRRLKLKIV